jgi:D-alanine-D-alanine ligase-like ATP-grasp enzyme
MINKIVFVNSTQPEIDRGWRPDDAVNEASRLGFAVLMTNVESRSALETLIASEPGILVWPVCYTIGSDPKGPLLSTILEQLGVPFVGAPSKALRLSSKLEFKEALAAQTPYRSPAYHLVNAGEQPNVGIGLPAVLKTEFSCNSEGVAVANDPFAFAEIFERLSFTYRQRVYVERWERAREYTVAYLPPLLDRKAIAAAIEIRVVGNAQYIDSQAKSDNSRLEFLRPEEKKAIQLEEMTIDIAALLDIDGHFRLDIVENSRGQLFPIEANFLPFLTTSGRNRSYFPIAFELASRLDYRQIIERILTHALKRHAKGERIGELQRVTP